MFRFALVCILVLRQSSAFSYHDCGGETSMAKLERLEISPSPLIIPGTYEITIALNILEDVPEDAEIRVEIFRKVKLFGSEMDIRLPCVNGVGSCTYTPCTLMEELGHRLCPLFPEGHECACPIKKGMYGREKTQLTTPDLSDTFKVLARGNYYGSIQVFSGADEQIACFNVTLQIDTTI